MIKFQKKPILVYAKEPSYICCEANGKHNEVTVIVAQYAVPLNYIFSNGSQALSPNMMRVILGAAGSFQGVDFGFNRDPKAPALTFTVKAKTERRGDDAPNQELANKIVTAKANLRACTIARRILRAVIKYYMQEITHISDVCNILSSTITREHSYIHKL